MTTERRTHLLDEARAHYDWLRLSGNSLDDIEVTCREILRLWNIDATAEVARLEIDRAAHVAKYRADRVEAARRLGAGPDEDTPGAFAE